MSKQHNVWYTSDLHIGHRLVAGKRGFWNDLSAKETYGEPDTEAHDDQIARNWDAVVKPNDIVFILGDISVSGSQHALDWIGERPGVRHLITGNHDPVHPQYRTSQKDFTHWLFYFDTIQQFARRKLGGVEFLMSHYPYWAFGDGPERTKPPRDEQYRLPDLGKPLLHGHTHGKEREHGSSFHVGLDAWDLQLVPQSVIQDWLTSLPKATS